ncbi:hypothetical protein ONZ51_g6920 [Trametes cubensis]|uniref:WW domain-containing protein n=1 Tax=Trametes cubensis TaxID=1111947 RepID=A0AAD7XA40_9APHY|nr:hypothetical protein ONZ51_g6920 [Trametes cubensis]
MSRPSSPTPDAASPTTSDNEHREQHSNREASEPANGASEPSRDNSEAPSGKDDASESASRETSTSPSAVDGGSTSTSTPAPGNSGSTSASAPTASSASTGTWQAVWSPAHNAYYFYNSVTQETTWVNPLQQDNAEAGPSSAPAAAASTTQATPGAPSSTVDLYAAAAAQGIDPALAHLDPSLVAVQRAHGAFARQDARDPTHLSEYERAKRMSEFYFDVNAWEKDVEMRKLQEAQEEESRKRKRPTKQDLERFKEKKKQKKLAKTAWLRT